MAQAAGPAGRRTTSGTVRSCRFETAASCSASAPPGASARTTSSSARRRCPRSGTARRSYASTGSRWTRRTVRGSTTRRRTCRRSASARSCARSGSVRSSRRKIRTMRSARACTVASAAMPLLPVDVAEGVSPSAYLGALGMTGLTAWIGIRDIGKPQPGETVVVSAAAGAVGSVAGQLAKFDGARVVGIAGGAEKCALLTDRLGFDAAIDHRADDWAAQLAAATPDGIDVDFENVGGDIMDAIFARLNIGARVALCGLISGYNSADPPPGPRAFANLLVQRATLQGFIVLDHFGRAPEAIGEIAGLIAEGRLTPLETVVEGFEQLPTAINMLFDGKNIGKLVVKTSG